MRKYTFQYCKCNPYFSFFIGSFFYPISYPLVERQWLETPFSQPHTKYPTLNIEYYQYWEPITKITWYVLANGKSAFHLPLFIIYPFPSLFPNNSPCTHTHKLSLLFRVSQWSIGKCCVVTTAIPFYLTLFSPFPQYTHDWARAFSLSPYFYYPFFSVI